jgi:SAM-dependent methyltransferase
MKDWNAHYAALDEMPRGVHPLLMAWKELLPPAGRCLDVACGTAKESLWLAQQGLDVFSCDMAWNGLTWAEKRFREAGLPFNGLLMDLTRAKFPANCLDVIINLRYLDRALCGNLFTALRPGGLLFFEWLSVPDGQPPTSYSEFYVREQEVHDLIKGFESMAFGREIIKTKTGSKLFIHGVMRKPN